MCSSPSKGEQWINIREVFAIKKRRKGIVNNCVELTIRRCPCTSRNGRVLGSRGQINPWKVCIPCLSLTCRKVAYIRRASNNAIVGRSDRIDAVEDDITLIIWGLISTVALYVPFIVIHISCTSTIADKIQLKTQQWAVKYMEILTLRSSVNDHKSKNTKEGFKCSHFLCSV